MKAVHRSLTGHGVNSGVAYATTVVPHERLGVAYGDIVKDVRDKEWYVIQASKQKEAGYEGCTAWRVSAVDFETWIAIRDAEQRGLESLFHATDSNRWT
jgi:hypothetical protein